MILTKLADMLGLTPDMLIALSLPVLGALILIAAAFTGGKDKERFKRRLKEVRRENMAARALPDQKINVKLSTSDSSIPALDRLIKKALPRRERKSLPLIATKFGELADVAIFRQATLATLARAGLLVCGDVAAALDVLDVGRGARAITDQPGALELLAWAVSDHHLSLRQQLELDVTP